MQDEEKESNPREQRCRKNKRGGKNAEMWKEMATNETGR